MRQENRWQSFLVLKIQADCYLNSFFFGNPGNLFDWHDTSCHVGCRVAKLFSIKNPGRLLFTKNTTESLNLAMYGFLRNGDHVVTTSMEHNSVLRPTLLHCQDISSVSPRKKNNGGFYLLHYLIPRETFEGAGR